MTRSTPPTPRMFQAIGRLNRTKSKLVDAVRDEPTLPGLRAAVLELASDIEAFLDGHPPMSEVESRRDTEPCPAPAPDTLPPWECTNLEQYTDALRAARRGECAGWFRYLDRDEPSAPDVPVNRPSGGP